MRKIKMLLVSPYTKDANSFWRAVGPWSYLAKMARKVGFDFEFDVAGEDLAHKGLAWDVMGRYDMAFFHRPCREDDLTIMKVARLMNVPTWVEFDDWLYEVPGWNPHAGLYAAPAVHQVISMMLACADLVSVTTSALYDRFRLVNPNVVIVPNSYRSDLYWYREETPPPRQPLFVWRGTNTHDADVLSVGAGWMSLPGKVRFYGNPPWMLLNQMQQARPDSFEVHGPQDPFVYMRELYNAAPKVLLCPLVDCFFNRVKSNIAYQEAIHAGALCVAPDLPEWRRPGVVTYEPGNALSFATAASSAFEMPQARYSETVADAYREMRNAYDAEVINEIRLKTLEAVLAPDFVRNRKNPWDQLLGLYTMSQLTGKPVSGPMAKAKQLLEEKEGSCNAARSATN